MTIYDIAREAGVSASTVSRVINHKPGIREETRRRIQKLLEEYDYTPDIAARGLATQATRFIGILIEDIRVSHHTESAYVIEQEMTRRGYTCITFSTGPDSSSKAKYIQILEQRRVEGVILIGSMFANDEVRRSLERCLADIPVMLVNGEMDLPNVYSVLIDEERGTEECVKMLVEKRLQTAGISDGRDDSFQYKKQRGFCTGLLRCGLEAGEDYIFTAPDADTSPGGSIRRGRQGTCRLLESVPEVDGIICATDLLAIGCLQELQKRGIAVPGQVSLIGIDNTLYGQLCTPALTTLDNKMAQVSLSAARMLLDVLDGRTVNQKLMLFTEIIRRESA